MGATGSAGKQELPPRFRFGPLTAAPHRAMSLPCRLAACVIGGSAAIGVTAAVWDVVGAAGAAGVAQPGAVHQPTAEQDAGVEAAAGAGVAAITEPLLAALTGPLLAQRRVDASADAANRSSCCYGGGGGTLAQHRQRRFVCSGMVSLSRGVPRTVALCSGVPHAANPAAMRQARSRGRGSGVRTLLAGVPRLACIYPAGVWDNVTMCCTDCDSAAKCRLPLVGSSFAGLLAQVHSTHSEARRRSSTPRALKMDSSASNGREAGASCVADMLKWAGQVGFRRSVSGRYPAEQPTLTV
jgi:hypothetical protein